MRRVVRMTALVVMCGALALVAGPRIADVAAQGQSPSATAPQTPPPPTTPPPDQPPPSAASQTPPVRDVTRIFGELCANCHGPTLAGNLAPSLLDDTWSFGGDDASLAQSIRDGRPTTAMPSFKAALSEQEIRALVIFIRETADRAKRTGVMAAPAPNLNATFPSELQPFKLEIVADNLDTPWGIAWLPDGRMLVTERPGRLRIVSKASATGAARSVPLTVTGVPPVWVKQDGGLFDVEVHPRFATNHFIYLAYSLPGSIPGTSATKIIRARLDGDRLTDITPIFDPTPAQYWEDNRHYGARFLFDASGHLFYSIGDRGHMEDSQDLSSPYGKLHRVNDDGSVPKDNPFVNRAGAVASIWSYGNRNQEGLAFDPVTGALWASEHGPRGGDELNIIEPGKNYGWPTITYGMNDDGTPITDKTAQEGMEQPVVYWTPSIAVCALAFYTSDRIPAWKNDLLVTALARQELRRLRIENGKVVHQEVLLRNLGRVRDVAIGPDGHVYVAFNQPGRIVRLVPAPTTGSAETRGR
jgi:aldose sugar dehydrogenase